MNPALLSALLTQVAVPEIMRWLKNRNSEDPITDAEIIAKLGVDADQGIAIGKAWLQAHPQ